MEQGDKRRLEDIIGGISCPKELRCYKSGFEDLCKAKDIGMEVFLYCLDKKPQECVFSMYFGDHPLCRCPLRMYIAKELQR